jgi:hypothetical protein
MWVFCDSLKMFFGGASHQGAFETASKEIYVHSAGHRPAECPSSGLAAPAERIIDRGF